VAAPATSRFVTGDDVDYTTVEDMASIGGWVPTDAQVAAEVEARAQHVADMKAQGRDETQ
jgi:hypothetical protein